MFFFAPIPSSATLKKAAGRLRGKGGHIHTEVGAVEEEVAPIMLVGRQECLHKIWNLERQAGLPTLHVDDSAFLPTFL